MITASAFRDRQALQPCWGQGRTEGQKSQLCPFTHTHTILQSSLDGEETTTPPSDKVLQQLL